MSYDYVPLAHALASVLVYYVPDEKNDYHNATTIFNSIGKANATISQTLTLIDLKRALSSSILRTAFDKMVHPHIFEYRRETKKHSVDAAFNIIESTSICPPQGPQSLQDIAYAICRIESSNIGKKNMLIIMIVCTMI